MLPFRLFAVRAHTRVVVVCVENDDDDDDNALKFPRSNFERVFFLCPIFATLTTTKDDVVDDDSERERREEEDDDGNAKRIPTPFL
jgi:hypothetical protein